MRRARHGDWLLKTANADMVDRVLHIGIDGREIGRKPPGVGRYLTNVLREWTSVAGRGHRYTIFSPAAAPESFSLPNVEWQVVPNGGSATSGTWWEQVHLPAAANRAHVDVFFAPAYTGPLRLHAPMVLTIHDLSYFAHPEWFGWREGWRRRVVTRQAARRAAAVVTISEFSAKEIQHYLGIDRSKITVIHHGSPALGVSPALSRQAQLLFVGSMFTRRHLPDLMEAFAEMSASLPDATLVLVGDNQIPGFDPLRHAQHLGIADRVTWHQWLSDSDLDRMYWQSRVFCFLSDYEGFALTPLEALAHDVPVILLDTPVGREIYGDAASFVTGPGSALAGAMHRALTDEPYRAGAIARGHDILARYSWTRTAAQVLDVIEGAARP